MKLHILGSGTCVPNIRRGSSGYALELSKSTILLDCGNGTTWKLGMVGVDYLKVDHIFITHFHPDHTADLIPFLFATKYPPKRQGKTTCYMGSKRLYQVLLIFKNGLRRLDCSRYVNCKRYK